MKAAELESQRTSCYRHADIDLYLDPVVDLLRDDLAPAG